MEAAYLGEYHKGKLHEKVRSGLKWLKRCTLCPRECRVNRLRGELGFCRTGRHAIVASYGPHFGEEKPLVGAHGSGTIFFSHCHLGCVFCQNYEISHGAQGTPIGAETLADIMVALQKRGCHNINFVTPTHVIVQILEALPLAVEKGLTVPLVYNCGGYERLAALRLLDGIIDIFMPDFKFWDSDTAQRLCDARDYPRHAREALKEMHRQAGELILDERGIAGRGVLVRHLVMPERLAGTEEVARFIAEELSPNTYVNIMSQYHPCGEALGMPEVGRTITSKEFQEAMDAAGRAGLQRLDGRHKHWISIMA